MKTTTARVLLLTALTIPPMLHAAPAGEVEFAKGVGAATASGKASASASPTSSLARITSRRAMNRASSPPASIFASQ